MKKIIFILMFFISSIRLLGQTVTYVDIDPDKVMRVTNDTDSNSDREEFELDIDNDGTNDVLFYLKHQYQSYEDCHYILFYARGLTDNFNIACISESEYDHYVQKIEENEEISSQLDYRISTDFYSSTRYGSTPCGSFFGQWVSFPIEAYMGFSIKKNNNYYYGWLRLSIEGSQETYQEVTIKDYAYCNLPNISIKAGQTTVEGQVSADAVASVAIADIDDNGDGRDLEVTFPKISDESTISEYRIMVVKVGNSFDFDLEKANAAVDYFTVAPSGRATYATNLQEGSKDVDGDKIATDVNYRAFVLSVANQTTTNANALSPYSNTLKLEGGGNFVDKILSSKLEIYPNPASSKLNIKLDEYIESLEIYNMSGQLMLSKEVKSNNYKLDISGLSKGTYNIIVNTKEAKATNLIVVE